MVVERSAGRDDLVLGYGSLEEYRQDTYYMGTVVGRIANCIAGGKVVVDGKGRGRVLQ